MFDQKTLQARCKREAHTHFCSCIGNPDLSLNEMIEQAVMLGATIALEEYLKAEYPERLTGAKRV